MTFPLTPAAPFTASVSTISAATANDWRTYISQSLDTVNGGAYVNVTSIDWSAGGAGWRFYAALAIKSTGSLTLDTGATVVIAADPTLTGTMRVGFGGAGGSVRFYATSTMQVDDTVACSFAGDWTCTSASLTTYQSGSTLSLGGNSTWASTSVCVHASSSTDTYQSGSSLTTNSGALINLTIGSGAAGSLALGASSTLTVTAGASVTMSVGGGGTPGTLTINADGTLTTSASSIFNQGGTTTRTGALTLSGTGASTALRYYAAPIGTYSINPKHYDRIYRTSGIGVADVLTLTPDPGASEFIELFLTYEENIGSSLEVRDAAAVLVTTIEFSATSETKSCVHFIWTGTFWRVLNRTFFS